MPGGKFVCLNIGDEGACHAATKQKGNGQIRVSAIYPDSLSYIGSTKTFRLRIGIPPSPIFFDFLATQNNRLLCQWMTALPPEADIRLILVKRAANDPNNYFA